MVPSSMQAQAVIANKVFPNLARHEPLKAIVDEVTAICAAELQAAGIKVINWPGTVRGEVPSKVVGGLSGWHFERRWYYWSASGPGIPPDIAERLHATHGKEVRVDGHCGCPSPLEWRKGFAIGYYHIDTQEGLNALADTLRSIYDADKDPDAQPYMGGEVKA